MKIKDFSGIGQLIAALPGGAAYDLASSDRDGAFFISDFREPLLLKVGVQKPTDALTIQSEGHWTDVSKLSLSHRKKYDPEILMADPGSAKEDKLYSPRRGRARAAVWEIEVMRTSAKSRSDTPADRIKERLTMDQTARHYGFEPNRSGFIRCPFHQGDHTASLKIYPGDRGWHCFGCGKGGSVIDFVMQLFHLTFPQAVVRLDADFRLGLTAERPDPGARAKMLEKRRREREEKERADAEYRAAAREHRYWWEVKKYFAPSREDWEAGHIHPLYLEALRRLPWLDDYLDRNLMGTTRYTHG